MTLLIVLYMMILCSSNSQSQTKTLAFGFSRARRHTTFKIDLKPIYIMDDNRKSYKEKVLKSKSVMLCDNSTNSPKCENEFF